jgi:hypothetical protein
MQEKSTNNFYVKKIVNNAPALFGAPQRHDDL